MEKVQVGQHEGDGKRENVRLINKFIIYLCPKRKEMRLKLFGMMALAGMTTLAACQQQAKPAEAGDTSRQAAYQAPYPAVFYDSLKIAMNSYYTLTQHLVAADDMKVNDAALDFKRHIDSLPADVLRSDSNIYSIVTSASGGISAELTGLLGETDIEKKRAAYHMVTDMLFDMVKATGLKSDTIYRIYCSMALGEGAYWLSPNTEIHNPYYGESMNGSCVSVTDTLRYQ
ncbi:DUF3347 domain-containing protein [Chitinophaga sedimenti]|uniref:DUF3347 domain-containing protein n=1 Tax=Chitinophaga sedimenti TaxID=2033606 RepID=UPI002004E42E|nr:DUF3347 domain-containing protein [Chitinophaga sedimenti]MCK7555227.1 DUF3347 domain-containing protein [Chitinophaga sedimenti]